MSAFHSVGLATEFQQASVVGEPVDDGGGHVVVAEHRSQRENSRLVVMMRLRFHTCRRCPGSAVWPLRYRSGGSRVRRWSGAGFGQGDKLSVQPFLVHGSAEHHDQGGGGEEPGLDALPAGGRSQGGGRVGLAGTDVSVEDEVLAAVDELQCYNGPGPDDLLRLDPVKVKNRALHPLEQLGYAVTVTQLPA